MTVIKEPDGLKDGSRMFRRLSCTQVWNIINTFYFVGKGRGVIHFIALASVQLVCLGVQLLLDRTTNSLLGKTFARWCACMHGLTRFACPNRPAAPVPMLHASAAHIAPQTFVQLGRCFRNTFLLTHKLAGSGTAVLTILTILCHRNSCRE